MAASQGKQAGALSSPSNAPACAHLSPKDLVVVKGTFCPDWIARIEGFVRVAGIQMVLVREVENSRGVSAWQETVPFSAVTPVKEEL